MGRKRKGAFPIERRFLLYPPANQIVTTVFGHYYPQQFRMRRENSVIFPKDPANRNGVRKTTFCSCISVVKQRCSRFQRFLYASPGGFLGLTSPGRVQGDIFAT